MRFLYCSSPLTFMSIHNSDCHIITCVDSCRNFIGDLHGSAKLNMHYARILDNFSKILRPKKFYMYIHTVVKKCENHFKIYTSCVLTT